MVETTESLEQVLNDAEFKAEGKKENLDDKLLDENGKPKNALYASIAAKKSNSVSLFPMNYLTC